MPNFFNYTVMIVVLGALGLGFVAGFFGSFVVVRKQSMISDALAHASFPGVVLAFMITESKNMGILLIGAFIAAGITMLLFFLIRKFTRIHNDASLAVIMAGLFGLGQVLLRRFADLNPSANQAGLSEYIFGQAATLLASDVILLWSVAIFSISIILIFWKELIGFSFDSSFMRASGFRFGLAEFLFSFLTIIIIVIGIHTVGVILVSALIIVPYIISRHFFLYFRSQTLGAALFGALAGVSGPLVAVINPRLPPGPVIVVVLSVFAIFGFIFGRFNSLLARNQQKKQWKIRCQKYPLSYQFAFGKDLKQWSQEERKALCHELKIDPNCDDQTIISCEEGLHLWG